MAVDGLLRIGAPAVDPLIKALWTLPSIDEPKSGNVAYVLGELRDRRALRALVEQFPVIIGVLRTAYFDVPNPKRAPKATYAAVHERVLQDWPKEQTDRKLVVSLNSQFVDYMVSGSEMARGAAIEWIPNPKTGGKAIIRVDTEGVILDQPAEVPIERPGSQGFTEIQYRLFPAAEALFKISGQDLGKKRFEQESWRQWLRSQEGSR
jgi:hypothetical protein